MSEIQRTGGCACGSVRFTAAGEPARVGLCHCMTCRKAHASAFNPFVVYRREQVHIVGATVSWKTSADYDRRFCPRCGSRLLGVNGEEYELSLGSFDEPGTLAPTYESWVVRREPWLPPLDMPQWPGNREV